MGFLRARFRPPPKPRERSRLSLILFLLVVYAGTRFLGHPATVLRHHAVRPLALPILPLAETNGASDPYTAPLHLAGERVRGNGSDLNLGDRRIHLPESLLSRFFPDALVAPSCLTQAPPPALPVRSTARPLPVGDEWPGFFGAPWTARIDGNLLALLQVYAPRNSRLAVPAPQFQVYPNYNGQQNTPSFSQAAPAVFLRGSQAVLYRVFPNGTVRCLDLVVQNGENSGVGHVYYRKYNHYYETDAIFHLQP